MMNNLFSIFDPSISFLSMSWVILPMLVMMLNNKMWHISSQIKKMTMTITKMMKKEVKFSLNKTELGTENIILTVFSMIVVMNVTALFPQVFSVTSHLTLTLPMSLLFWISLMMFSWSKNTNHMLSHLLPQGTPIALMLFMVLIEMVGNLIRPITLCVRLTANLIAGHLLMSLLGNFLMGISFNVSIVVMLMPIILTILETVVAFIQGYVFMTLITLYVTETK